MTVYYMRYLSMTLSFTPLFHPLLLWCGSRVSKPHFCSAAGSLLGSAKRGCQRETARLGREKRHSAVCCYTPFSIMRASLFNPVCPHLQNQPHCSHSGDASPPYQDAPQNLSPGHAGLSSKLRERQQRQQPGGISSSEAEQPLTEPLLQVQCFTNCLCFPPGLPLGHLQAALSDTLTSSHGDVATANWDVLSG